MYKDSKWNNLIFLLSLMVCTSSHAFAQFPNTFEKKYKFDGCTGIGGIVELNEDSFMMCTTLNIDFSNAKWGIFKTDRNGELLWSKFVGEQNTSRGHGHLIQISEDEYFTAGSSNHKGTSITDDAMVLIKWNQHGDTIWAKLYEPGNQSDRTRRFIHTSDNGFLLVGNSQSLDNTGYVVKTNIDGDTIWTKSYFTSDGNQISANSILESDEGGYLIMAIGFINNLNRTGTWLIKITTEGEIEWSKSYAFEQPSINNFLPSTLGRDIVQTSEGDYIISGAAAVYFNATNVYRNNSFLIKVNATGEILWEYLNNSELPNSLRTSIIVDNNRLLVTGISRRIDTTVTDGFISLGSLKSFDLNGNLIWERDFGTHLTELGPIINTSNGGFAFGGIIFNDDCNCCSYFIKTDSLGCIEPGCHVLNTEQLENNGYFNVFPNPAGDYINLHYKVNHPQNVNIIISDILGRRVLHQSNEKIQDENTLSLITTGLTNGIYFLNLLDLSGKSVYTSKIIIQR